MPRWAQAHTVSVDIPRILRVARWIGSPDPKQPLTVEEIEAARANPVPRQGELPIPKYPFPIDEPLAARGQAIYQQYCAACHDWRGAQVGQVVPIDKIGTDSARLDSYTVDFAFNQNTFGAGQWWRFHNFRKTNGYVSMPLDGLWARAPYLHNGSVPTLNDLLKKASDRLPKDKLYFWRGDDEYDPINVGFRSDRDRSADGRKLFRYDTTLGGNGNQGHEGRVYGTELSDGEKRALLEYLKKL